MTIGNSSKQLQEGIQKVKDGSLEDAYNIFRKLTDKDPNNEFAWIWLATTSTNPAEKRSALGHALDINPNSSHAKDALLDLDMKMRAAQPSEPPFSLPPLPGNPPIGIPPENDDPLATLRATPGSKKNKKQKKTAATKGSTQQPGKKGSRRFRLAVFAIAVAILVLSIAFVVTQNQNNTQTVATDENTTPTVIITTTVTTPVPSETTAEVTPTVRSETVAVTTQSAVQATTVVAGQSGTGGTAADRIDKLVLASRKSADAGDFKAAVASLNEALGIEPRNIPANFELGLTYMHAPDDQSVGGGNRFEAATQSFKRVTEQAPIWAGGWARYGEALSARGDVPGAIKALARSLELDPNGAERWLTLAVLYERNNQQAEAGYARQRAQGINATPPPGAPR
ncbi:tetratricopeptide repeat protein [Candidatus Chlorohelix sp.]|uniref:tetratricopeptide repeat protein n=1 Tax=Candidatus Chlorohelix sp. TaxID=3139201 RepID=UPI003050B5AB